MSSAELKDASAEQGQGQNLFKQRAEQNSRLAEFDEVLVGGGWRQASDVQVGLTKLLHKPSSVTASSTSTSTCGARTGWSHRWWGRSIGLLQRQRERKKMKNHTFYSFPITILKNVFRNVSLSLLLG